MYLPACTAPGWVVLAWGMYLPGGVPAGVHTLLKILPCPNLVVGSKKPELFKSEIDFEFAFIHCKWALRVRLYLRESEGDITPDGFIENPI